MAAAITLTEQTTGTVKKIVWEWTSNASGDVTDAPSGETTVYAYSGKVEALVTDPDGTSAPTDDYDITILDEDGYDVLAGAGANRDTANTETVLASSLGIVANSKLTLTVANAGDTKAGIVTLYLR